MNWRDEAACLGADTAIFFAEGRTGPTAWDVARAVCLDCPVMWPCRLDALEMEANAGQTWRYSMRGGLSPKERKEVADWRELARSWEQWQAQRDRFEMFNEEWADA